MLIVCILLALLCAGLAFWVWAQRRSLREAAYRLRALEDTGSTARVRLAVPNSAAEELLDEVNRLLELRQADRAAYQARERALRQQIANVSHDLRTPLTSIIGATSTVLENPDLSEEEQRALLADVRDDAQWLIRVVENLLSITRIGDEPANISKESEAAEEVLGEAVRKFRKRFPAVSVEVHVPDELLLVPMDPILIEQVLSNLLENAVFHGETTTRIVLSVQREGNRARFVVQDNGCGIPPEKLHTLFDGALKCDESAPRDGKRNMGLGLSVCMAIVRAHGGTMEAENTSSGAAFSFCLPLSKEEPI